MDKNSAKGRSPQAGVEAVADQTLATVLGTVRRKDEYDIGLVGMLSLLEDSIERNKGDLSGLNGLPDDTLLTLSMQASNCREDVTAGMETLAGLLNGYDRDFAELDAQSVGWLLRTLADQLKAATRLGDDAKFILSTRGVCSDGTRLPAVATGARA